MAVEWHPKNSAVRHCWNPNKSVTGKFVLFVIRSSSSIGSFGRHDDSDCCTFRHVYQLLALSFTLLSLFLLLTEATAKVDQGTYDNNSKEKQRNLSKHREGDAPFLLLLIIFTIAIFTSTFTFVSFWWPISISSATVSSLVSVSVSVTLPPTATIFLTSSFPFFFGRHFALLETSSSSSLEDGIITTDEIVVYDAVHGVLKWNDLSRCSGQFLKAHQCHVNEHGVSAALTHNFTDCHLIEMLVQ